MYGISNVPRSVLRAISGRVIMYIRVVVSWRAAFPFLPRNYLWLPLRIFSGGGGGDLTRINDRLCPKSKINGQPWGLTAVDLRLTLRLIAAFFRYLFQDQFKSQGVID